MQAQPYSFWVSAFTLAGEGQVSEIVAETPQVSMPAGIASFSQVRFSHHFDQNLHCKLGEQMAYRCLVYRTRAIITRGLYYFYPIFLFH